MKRSFSFITFAVLLGVIGYVHGFRIVTLADVPSSKRPWGVFLEGGI